ncbi:NFACT RNA binding domain-containing protein [Candidatus Micrarchaeota archaeon]|nr:NFACT RNA binding domain-containing protein [Candidatus Micrarchaeota archaeon]
MRIRLFYNKSVHENAAYYYELAKASREKISGVEKAMEETKKEMDAASVPEKKDVRVKKSKEWHEKFHSAYTSEGKLMIGGRSAQQNDQVVSKHMEDSDLFFHADIQGGAVFVLKDGIAASEGELREAAQMAASFSNSWKNGNASVDVYAVEKKQLTKNMSGGFVPAGAFAILGERRWFRAVKLALRIGLAEKGISLVPECSKARLKDELVLVPSPAGKDKGSLAKSLAKRFGLHPDDFLELLPNGKTKTLGV